MEMFEKVLVCVMLPIYLFAFVIGIWASIYVSVSTSELFSWWFTRFSAICLIWALFAIGVVAPAAGGIQGRIEWHREHGKAN